ncbi:MAG: YihY/virulence factor BrkB family protein [Lentisphaerae bacterium]|nr:YihY/virulence factor BrkB family protein [Lentisphaerota bacterium]
MDKKSRRPLSWYFRRWLNVIIESFKTFAAAEGQLRASSLTYFTLFAIVPVFALLFGVAKGFELDEWLKRELESRMSEHSEVLSWLYNFADTTLRETKGGIVAGVGALILCWSVIKMIGNIEKAVNRVWQVKKDRTIFRKITDYLSFLVIAPVLLLAASSASVVVAHYLQSFSENHRWLSGSRALIEFGLQCVPYFLTWMLFTFIYVFLPNTRVRFSAALFGGVLAGSIYQLLQGGYIFVQMALSRYNVIYGSFSALPLFLIWLYLSWLIVLYGVTLSFLYQRFDYDSKQARDHERSEGEKRLLALLMAACCAKEFAEGKALLTADDLAAKLNISFTLTNEILFNLCSHHILTAAASEEYDNPGYTPAMPLEKMTLLEVLTRYDNWQLDETVNITAVNHTTVQAALRNIAETVKKSDQNILLHKLIC